ncbi:MAG: Response regulator receiver [Candidatus Woesebacteria bacterium GW2011_GWC1_38_13]|uniref:Response regulator receiver n=3 Tax=Candidatus Woeseibacteriota TaxID=1752722 RepID=A0A0G0KWR8_9BACT|nr:MAG: Response regulator receiver [Candidatus Woesebacteria bacterium GW2011_GWD1_38_10]KKQ57044.1 MAG: Response regulator receiver [Candidatus Woesebacteria bacterium GW2011_GWC1_38_13]KKQ76325.1 MAG: Response regulator receiver [Microgenomates group bacterium GW2011_GWF1_38_5]KKQ84103.1 MAG: Response regulator receiver [Candidatus Woesebacteria bacterium GW2011_GWA1_38_8]
MNDKILIVEDEETILSVLVKKLTECGFSVDTANDGETGLDKALNNNPDLILLDIVMPKMDGLTFIENYNQDKQTNKAPIIILSNLDNAEKIKECKEKGVYDYLVKTNWSLDDVVSKVKTALGN